MCFPRSQEYLAPKQLVMLTEFLVSHQYKLMGILFIHLYLEKNYSGLWAPGYKKLVLPDVPFHDPGLIRIDHIVGNVELDKMDYWGDFYEKIFGFTTFVRFDETDISTQYSSFKSLVVRSKTGKF